MQFQTDTGAYERGRPDYPQKVIDFLSVTLPILPSSLVLEIAAGTGKFTRLLLECGVKIIAMDPLQNMRERFVQKFPSIQVIDGVAESIPLPDQSVDHVFIAQAFHWFDAPKAMREIYRVLKPKGNLALVWNVQDRSYDWVDKLGQIVDVHEKGIPQYRTSQWKSHFTGINLFSPIQQVSFQHTYPSSPEMIIDRVASISFIAALPEAERKSVLKEVCDLIESHPDVRSKSTIDFPYITDVYFCHKS
ncbi:MAG: methyltransferase domain-containing protein [Proteobacteria bacterium]|jgi:SAM-dependent methyltransferase|nr:methyltransferase domain-containing protein [Pseudomonadota bacterium]